jgi:death-on-curing protein
VRSVTLEEVLLLHARLIQRTGGSGGVHDIDLLDPAMARPRATFEGEELYPDLWHKAAALMHSLVKNHPFVDGNKRTALTPQPHWRPPRAAPQDLSE